MLDQDIEFFNNKIQTESDLSELISQLEDEKEFQNFELISFFSRQDFDAHLQGTLDSLENSHHNLHQFIESNFLQDSLFSTILSVYKNQNPELYDHCRVLRNATLAKSYVDKHCDNQIDRAISNIEGILSKEMPFSDDKVKSQIFCQNMVCLSEVTKSNSDYDKCRELVERCHQKILNCPFDSNSPYKPFNCFHHYLLLPQNKELFKNFFIEFSKPYFDRGHYVFETTNTLYHYFQEYEQHFYTDFTPTVTDQAEKEAEDIFTFLSPLLIRYLIDFHDLKSKYQYCNTFKELKLQELLDKYTKFDRLLVPETFRVTQAMNEIRESVKYYKDKGFPELEVWFFEKLKLIDDYFAQNMKTELMRSIEFVDYLAGNGTPIQLPNVKCTPQALADAAFSNGSDAMVSFFSKKKTIFQLTPEFSNKELCAIIRETIQCPQRLKYDFSLGFIAKFYDIWISTIASFGKIAFIKFSVDSDALNVMADSCKRIRWALFNELPIDIDRNHCRDEREYVIPSDCDPKVSKIITELNGILIVTTLISKLQPNINMELLSLFEDNNRNERLTEALNTLASRLNQK